MGTPPKTSLRVPPASESETTITEMPWFLGGDEPQTEPQSDDTLPPGAGHASETPPMFETRAEAQPWGGQATTPPTLSPRRKVVMPLPSELTPPTATTRDAAAFVSMRSLLADEAEPSPPRGKPLVVGWALAIVAAVSMCVAWWWLAMT